jgi:hypothetical protein
MDLSSGQCMFSKLQKENHILHWLHLEFFQVFWKLVNMTFIFFCMSFRSCILYSALLTFRVSVMLVPRPKESVLSDHHFLLSKSSVYLHTATGRFSHQAIKYTRSIENEKFWPLGRSVPISHRSHLLEIRVTHFFKKVPILFRIQPAVLGYK